MLTKTRVHIAGILAAVLVLFLCAGAGAAKAEGVPQHLASMAKTLYAGVKGELDEATGDPQQDAIRRRARQIIKDAGVRYWAQGEVRQKGAAAAVAGALEMDISKADQWVMLRSILGESDRDKQIDGLRRWARDAGKPSKGPEFDKLLAKFDEARAGAAKDLARRHTMEFGDNKDRLELDWDPINNGFEIRIRARETSQGAGDGFDLQLHGDVTSAPAIESDDTILAVRPSDSAMSVLTDEELRRLQGTIFGKWREGDGKIWEFSSAAGGGKAERPSLRAEDRIAELERQIKRIRSDKVYKWKNSETSEVVVQDKFKRLKKPFKYLGEKFGRADGEAEITRLKEKIKEVRAASKPLPVDANNPVWMKEMRASGKARSLNIRVTDKNGYSWTYDEAMLLNGRITAARTLRSMKDSPRLPRDVMRQAIASWSPPEWIELEVRVEGRSRQVYMTGLLWRMHVTYDGASHEIESLHTPYSRNLRLERAALKVAEGAAKDQKP